MYNEGVMEVLPETDLDPCGRLFYNSDRAALAA